MRRVSDLHHVHRSSASDKGDTKAKQEPTTLVLRRSMVPVLNMDSNTLYNRTNDDEQSTDPHTTTTTQTIDRRADERNSSDGSNLVHRRDDTGPDAGVATVEVLAENGVDQEVVEQGAVVAVGRGAEES